MEEGKKSANACDQVGGSVKGWREESGEAS